MPYKKIILNIRKIFNKNQKFHYQTVSSDVLFLPEQAILIFMCRKIRVYLIFLDIKIIASAGLKTYYLYRCMRRFACKYDF